MSRPVVEFLKEYAEAAEDLAEEAKMRAEAAEKARAEFEKRHPAPAVMRSGLRHVRR